MSKMTKFESSGSDNSLNRSQQRKEKQRCRQKKDKMKPLTKVIIRHLPPTMTEEEFLKQIELPDYDFFYYANADWSLGNCATCRAYVTLKRYDDVFLFRDRFDGYVFVDSKGVEYPAIVEFAPFQGLLKNRSRRSDNKVNTIEEESHYQQFLAKLEEEREVVAKGSDVKLEFSLDRKKEEITSTPLLQYLANKKEKRREEAKRRSEEKRRQREEEKERRRQVQQQHQQVKKIMASQTNIQAGSTENSTVENKAKDGNTASGGECKNSRARRKAEREQRRKEQRKKAQLNIEEKPEPTIATVPAEEKPAREPKKYSEKRERDRERNRNRKDKEKPKQSETCDASGTSSTTTIQTVASISNEESTTKLKSKDEQISDTVLNFIRSVASVREFVPKHKQQSEEQDKVNEIKISDNEVPSSSSNESRLDVKSTNEKEKTIEIQEKKDADSKRYEQQTEKQKREERRIRNKDRPSIAIYQPKPRQRASEDSDSNIGNSKDVRSNPTSDCESIKKDDSNGGRKKVSRYSERRSERKSSNAPSKSKSIDKSEDEQKSLNKSLSTEEPSKLDAAREDTFSKDSFKKTKTEIEESQGA